MALSFCSDSSSSRIRLSRELYLCCCFSLRIISAKVVSLPTTVTHFLALVTAVYRRFRFISILGPERIGRITAGYSEPWDLCMVTA